MTLPITFNKITLGLNIAGILFDNVIKHTDAYYNFNYIQNFQ